MLETPQRRDGLLTEEEEEEEGQESILMMITCVLGGWWWWWWWGELELELESEGVRGCEIAIAASRKQTLSSVVAREYEKNKNRNKQQQQLELVVQLMFSKKLLEIGPSIFQFPFSLQFSLAFLFPWNAQRREGKGRGRDGPRGFHIWRSMFHPAVFIHPHSLSPRFTFH